MLDCLYVEEAHGGCIKEMCPEYQSNIEENLSI